MAQIRTSLIIPSLNDSQHLEASLGPWRDLPWCEVIVVEAGSTVQDLPCQVLSTNQPGRAAQMNLGAQQATGQILCFLHADTRLEPRALHDAYHILLHDPGYAGGAFRFRLDAQTWRARVMEWGVRLRHLLCRLPYGDQAIFVRRDIFERMGGFPAAPILEDVLFVQRLKKEGRLYFSKAPAITSARKWARHGYLATMLANWRTMWMWWKGIPLDQIAQYRRQYATSISPSHT
jgi:rSAM/selenodomain-associated transferase 2